MIKFETLQITDFFKGAVLGLTPAQAEPRAHNLEKVRKGVFAVIAPVQFKAGEIIKLDDPDKATRAKLDCLEPEKEAARKEAAEKATADKGSTAQDDPGADASEAGE